MKFEPTTDMFCGRSCATSYDTGASWGLGLRFTKPVIDERPDFKLDEVETSQGKIYLKMRITHDTREYYSGDHRGKDNEVYPRTKGPDGIEHYTCAEVVGGFRHYCHAKVGMCLTIDYGTSYGDIIAEYKRRLGGNKYKDIYDRMYDEKQLQYYEGFIEQSKKQEETIEKVLEGIPLYKSIRFYNLVHGERKDPSCTLYIYDKEMKNAIPSGV